MIIRPLRRSEIEQIWTIDRSEIIKQIYTLQGEELVLQQHYFDVRDWPPGEVETYTPLLFACFDRGAMFIAAFDEERLVGAAVLDTQWRGPQHNLLQLFFLHVSYGYRDQGLGTTLFRECCRAARERGAGGLYISATPSEHTINFYLGLGCAVTQTPDPELLALEPKDIHMEYLFDERT